MQQAALFDGLRLDLLSLSEDLLGPAEVDVGRCEVSEALVVALVIVVLDEAGDGLVQRTRQVVVLEKDAVLQSLVPPLDLALHLGVVRSATDMVHAVLLKPAGEITGDVGGAIVAEQPRPVRHRWAATAGNGQGRV